jgi:hypothetical protein
MAAMAKEARTNDKSRSPARVSGQHATIRRISGVSSARLNVCAEPIFRQIPSKVAHTSDA